MADEVRQVRFDFEADVSDLVKGTESVSMGMTKATDGMSLATQAMSTLKGAALTAGAEAASMAAEWAVEGIAIASSANKIATNFERVFGETNRLNDEVEELAGHMGLAEHEAQALLAEVGMLGQSMGMTKDESAAYAEQMFRLAGDMARFNPEAGSAADAMTAMTKAANGSTKGMAAWGVSLKSAEVNQRALLMTGKESTAQLTQEDKALATLALTMEKTSDAQGQLNEDMEAGKTKYAEADASIADMQVQVGNALMPIKKLAMEGIVVLSEVLVALMPIVEAVGTVLSALLEVIKPLLPIISAVSQAIAVVLTGAIRVLMGVLQPFIVMLKEVSKWIEKVSAPLANFKIPNIKMPSFHSGGTVPGAEGTLQPIMAQGGETIGRPDKGGGGGPTTVVNITVNAGLSDPMATARQVADLLTQYTAQQGPIDVKVRNS